MIVGVYSGKPSEDGGVKQDTTALECIRLAVPVATVQYCTVGTRTRYVQYCTVLVIYCKTVPGTIQYFIIQQ